MKRVLIRLVVVLALVELAYLVVANAFLALPATQTLLNRSQDGRLVIDWNWAWTWFPFWLSVDGLTVNGQSWSQQFEVSIPSVSAAVDVPSLFSRTLRFNNLRTADINVRFRPRPSPDRDDSALRPFYPPIPGRDPSLAAEPVPTQSPGWKVVFDIAEIGGNNDLWLAANRMTLSGSAAAVITRQNRHGPLAITDGEADLTIAGLSVAGKHVSDGGSFKGDFDVAAFLPQENRGMKLLAFLSLDADVDLPIDGIDFLNAFLTSVADMSVGGKGELKGHVAYRKGALVPGADLLIDAENLWVDLPPYAVRGNGAVSVKVGSATPDTLTARLRFKSLSALHEPDDQTLFTGTNIDINVARSTTILPDAMVEKVPRRVAMTLSNVTVPDVSAYQRYLPDEWNAQLVGGSGSLDGEASMSAGELDFNLILRSDKAEVKFSQNSFESGLVLGVKAKGAADASVARVDVAGTFIELDDSRVKNRQGERSSPWQTRFAINAGTADFRLPDDQDRKTGVVGFWSLFQNRELKSMLGDVNGRVQGSLNVSDLDWVNFLFRRPFSLSIAEPAEVEADLTVEAGRLVADSKLTMPPRKFTLAILDYVVEGTGGFALSVAKSDTPPDLQLNAGLTDASLRLEDETAAVVEDVTLNVSALAENVSPKDGGAVKTVEMTIPSAKITDMTAYNVYLPKSTPIRIVGGTAELSARLEMGEDDANGFMKMTTSRVDTDIAGDRISGVIALDVAIAGGSVKERRFNISGSTLSVNDVRVTGSHATSGGWSGRVDLGKASVVWKRPMTLSLSGSFHMTDASPLLAVFSANRKDNKWLDRLLDLKNINGKASIEAEPDSVVVPYAFATSDTFDVGAKGIFGAGGRQGVFYARTGKLAGILAIDNKQKKFELLDATRKFEGYKPGGPVPGIHDQPTAAAEPDNAPAAPAAKPKKQPFSLFKRRQTQ
ncbi:MAG TPA: hypothetical protein VFK86_11045 [Bauldia sp.]|nr:hypothetical protein [Bauldia sp.]